MCKCSEPSILVIVIPLRENNNLTNCCIPVKQNVPTVFEKFISYLTKESRRNGGVLRKPNKKRDEMGEEEDRESIHLKKLSEVIFIVFSKGNSFCLENKQLFFKDIWPGAIPFFSSTGSV